MPIPPNSHAANARARAIIEAQRTKKSPAQHAAGNRRLIVAGCLTTGWLAKESAGLNSFVEIQSQKSSSRWRVCNVSSGLSWNPRKRHQPQTCGHLFNPEHGSGLNSAGNECTHVSHRQQIQRLQQESALSQASYFASFDGEEDFCCVTCDFCFQYIRAPHIAPIVMPSIPPETIES